MRLDLSERERAIVELLTDSGLSQEAVEALRDEGLELILA